MESRTPAVPPDNELIERRIREAFDAADHQRAATLAIEQYGPELLGFLVAGMRNPDDASEAFAQFGEAFWRALPSFEWRCSVRTFAYKLLRNTAAGYRRRERKHDRDRPLTQPSMLSVAIERVRTATAAYRRTDVKDALQQLREQLPDQDQQLLVLRVDRGLDFLEIAEVMFDDTASPTPEQLKTEAARLRKRFQLAKDRLRTMAEDAGLLDR
jgi:RNA polymerase sigma-70 factor (ECF subfamily)